MELLSVAPSHLSAAYITLDIYYGARYLPFVCLFVCFVLFLKKKSISCLFGRTTFKTATPGILLIFFTVVVSKINIYLIDLLYILYIVLNLIIVFTCFLMSVWGKDGILILILFKETVFVSCLMHILAYTVSFYLSQVQQANFLFCFYKIMLPRSRFYCMKIQTVSNASPTQSRTTEINSTFIPTGLL